MTQPLPTPEELAPMLARAAADYPAIKQQAESRAVSWVWATGPMYSLSPGFDALIQGWKKGNKLAAEPALRAHHFQYGLDTAGRAVVVRQYSEIEGNVREEFFTHHDGSSQWWSFSPYPDHKNATGVGHYLFEGPRLVGYSSLHDDGRSMVETYDYDGDRLKTLRRSGNNYAGGTYHHDYDAAGRLSTVTMEAPNGQRGVVYQRSVRSLPVLLKEIKVRLLDLIPKRVAALALAEPAFGLALVYEPGSALSMLPPKLALGLASEREKWRASGAAREALWDAQGFSTFDHDSLEFDDPVLLADAGEIANHLRSAEGMEKAHKLLVDVAKELNKVDWSAMAKVTPDFVVYPVDLHMEHLDRDMAAAVPAAKLKALKARKEL